MPPINQPADLDRTLADLQRQIDELKHLVSLTTTRGSLILPPGTSLAVQDVDGQILGYIGSFARTRPDGQFEQGVRYNRDDGSAAFTIQAYQTDAATMADYRQFFALWDGSGQIVVSDDAASRGSLSRPFVPIPLTETRYPDWPAVTDGAFVGVWDSAYFYKVNARAWVDLRVACDVAGTTGEVMVLVDGVQVGTTQSVGFVIEGKRVGPFVIPGDAYSQHIIEVRARRTAGTGAVRVAAHAWGTQS